ncbi:MAG: outer-membrane lipoprotein carrier protein LolA [Elusimicrobiales bacterium]|nr:outer-membrane lipoprotein carrier protein LolA [Elusimicrobiales bacterium]
MKKILLSVIFLQAPVFAETVISTTTSTQPSVVVSTTDANPIEKLKEWDSNLKSLKANFSQEVFFKTAEIKENIDGSIVYQKADGEKKESLKISHYKPQEQIIIISSEKDITIVKPADKQIVKSDWEKWKASLEPKLKGLMEFGNYSKLATDATITTSKDGDNTKININPKAGGYTLILKLNKDYFPVEGELDMGDTLIKTYLKDVQINSEIDKGEFNYQNTKKFEVLEI